jgi:alpha-tubulin suppressor-like RCC1 family protein
MKACKWILGSVFSLLTFSATTLQVAAVVTPGGVWAWGAGETNGADPNNGQSIIPSSPVLSSDTIALSAGGAHTLALKSGGTVVAWGRNIEGQTNVPSGLSGVTAIAAGGLHSLALKSDGSVVAWGRTVEGQVTVPAGLTTYTNVAATTATRVSGTVTNKVILTTLDPAVLAPGMRVTGTAGIGVGVFIVGVDSASKTLYLSASNTSNDTATTLTISSGVTAIAAGYYHSLALKSDGTVVAWGRGTEGQTTVPNSCAAYYANATFLANTTPKLRTATLVVSNANIVAGMRVFGPQPALNINGTVGVGATVVSNSGGTALVFDKDNTNIAAIAAPGTPLAFLPPAARPVTAIAAGYAHSVALMSDGTVIAWGDNSVGQTSTSGWTNVKAIAAGDYFTMALNTSGAVLAVGNNVNQQTDVPAAAFSDVTAIAAGGDHAVALKTTGTVLAWGRITKDGVTFIPESVPDALSGVTPFPEDESVIPHVTASVTAITAGGDHTGVIAVGPPIIITQPVAPAIEMGDNVTLKVTAMNAIGYQWYENGVPMSGKTSATLELLNVQTIKSYYVKITNSLYSTTSIPVLPVMITRPAVTSQPLDVWVRLAPGSVLRKVDKNPLEDKVNATKYYDLPLTDNTVTLYAQISGGGMTYQWMKNGVDIANSDVSPRAWGTIVEGATTNVLELSNITTTDDAGTYTLVAKNDAGSVTTRSAILRVDPLGIISLPQITSNLYELSPLTTPALRVGTPMTYAITANTITASTPVSDKPSYAASGLPKGLKINTKTGVISGTPSKAGAYLVTLQAKKKGTGTATATLRMVVGARVF